MNGILRPSNHLLRMAAIALIAGCAVVSSAFAAPRPDFAARFLESAHVPGVRGETVLFGPLQQMRLRVTFFNDADADQSLLLKGAYFQHIAWRWVSADGRAVDLHASWSNDAECHGPGLPMSCGLTEDRIFAPSVSVEGTVTLTLTDAAYDFGEFTLVVDLGPAAAYLQDVDHRPWNGKMISPRRFPIVIRSPANLYEQGLQHRLRGDQEAASGNHQAALTWFRQWAAAVPGDPAAVNAVGETLFLLKRFPEALNELRRADALTSNGDSLVPHNVAAALFALGRGSEAEAYLKQRYPKSPDTVLRLVVLARTRADRAKHQP